MKEYLLNLRKILLDNKEEVSELEMTSGNYDNEKLIKEKIPTLTTDFCEIGIYDKNVYFVVIVYSNTFDRDLFNSLKDISNIQIYGFKNFKENLYPKNNFNYKEFGKEIKKDRYLQIQFNFEIEKLQPELLYKGYTKIKSIFSKSKVKIINQLEKHDF